MSTVVITGASGRMAAAIRPRLRELFDEVVLFARSDINDLVSGERLVRGDLVDSGQVAEAMRGADAVVHLGGKADEAAFELIRDANITGTYNVFEAAKNAGVRRVIYASSHHVTGFHKAQTMVTEASPVRPDTLYAVSKVFGEALGRLYADKWGLEVVCLRIGVCREEPENSDQLRTWLSIPDSVALVEAAIFADLPDKYHIAYGLSDNAGRFWSLDSALALGYTPQHSANDHATGFDRHAPFSSKYQGGRFAEPDYGGGTW